MTVKRILAQTDLWSVRNEHKFTSESVAWRDETGFWVIREHPYSGRFRLETVTSFSNQAPNPPNRFTGWLYHPIHPDTRTDTILGAIHAEVIDGFWCFSGVYPYEHRALAFQARQFVYGLFRPDLDALLLKVGEADNATARTTAAIRTRYVRDFAFTCADLAHEHVLSTPIGATLQRDFPTIASTMLEKERAKLKAKASANPANRAQYLAANRVAATVLTELREEFVYTFEAQLAEKRVKAGKDPVAGREVVYALLSTSVAELAKQTTTHLGNDDWRFEEPGLSDGLWWNGAYYYDAEPSANGAYVTVVRLWRPVPASVSSGDSVGDVQWRAGAPYAASV